MSSLIFIQEELATLNCNIPVVKNAAGTAPENYFDSLAEKVLSRINEAEAKLSETPQLLQKISRTMPNSIPEGYFEQQTTFPLIAQALPLTPPAGAVPEQYFEELPTRILQNVRHNNKKSVIRPLFITIRKYAAILIVMATIAGGIFMHKNNNSGTITDTELMSFLEEEAPIEENQLLQSLLADVSGSEASNYLKELSIDDDYFY